MSSIRPVAEVPWSRNEIKMWVDRELEEVRRYAAETRRLATSQHRDGWILLIAASLGAAIVAAGAAFARFVL